MHPQYPVVMDNLFQTGELPGKLPPSFSATHHGHNMAGAGHKHSRTVESRFPRHAPHALPALSMLVWPCSAHG